MAFAVHALTNIPRYRPETAELPILPCVPIRSLVKSDCEVSRLGEQTGVNSGCRNLHHYLLFCCLFVYGLRLTKRFCIVANSLTADNWFHCKSDIIACNELARWS